MTLRQPARLSTCRICGRGIKWSPNPTGRPFWYHVLTRGERVKDHSAKPAERPRGLQP